MNRSRMLILLGILLLVGALAVLVILPSALTPPPPDEPVATPEPEIPTTEIIVAAQSIPRGAVISPDAVVPSKWPNDSLPPADLIIVDPEEVIGKIARTDILRGQPALKSLVASDPKDLVARGGDASLFIPPDKRAIAFPINKFSSVGYSIGSGDHVDVVVVFSIIDVDQEGQYPIIPFNRDLVDELIAAGMEPQEAVSRVITKLDQIKPEPRLLSQLTLQNIEILHVGEWPVGGVLPRPTPTLSPDQIAAQQPAAEGGTPTATPPRPDMIVLLVDPQQALILTWMMAERRMGTTLVLRGAGDNAPVSTETVSFQYIVTTFNIAIPPKTNTILPSQDTGGQAPSQ
jgi:Flp pilus assembly protein CpaB